MIVLRSKRCRSDLSRAWRGARHARARHSAGAVEIVCRNTLIRLAAARSRTTTRRQAPSAATRSGGTSIGRWPRCVSSANLICGLSASAGKNAFGSDAQPPRFLCEARREVRAAGFTRSGRSMRALWAAATNCYMSFRPKVRCWRVSAKRGVASLRCRVSHRTHGSERVTPSSTFAFQKVSRAASPAGVVPAAIARADPDAGRTHGASSFSALGVLVLATCTWQHPLLSACPSERS